MRFLWISQHISREKTARKYCCTVEVKALSPTANRKRYIFHFSVQDSRLIPSIGMTVAAPVCDHGASVKRMLYLAVSARTSPITKRREVR